MWLQWLITSFNLKLMNFRREVKIYDPGWFKPILLAENFFQMSKHHHQVSWKQRSERSIRKPSMTTTVDNKWSPMWLFFYVLTKKVTFDLYVLYSVWHLPIPRLHTKSVPSIVTSCKLVLLVKLYFYMPHLSSSFIDGWFLMTLKLKRP